ncbi:hypothetical protein CTAYLR_010129 [Chrysophaeum taylorii]|uniref:Amino acid transporter transmembrane domain-containing protein n=1 Tax=Chrysophaeum taylorii TaxID=2483200 RepID=A0AAD7UM13_9STRA|nr:hypothetical protein CTAYLR_010129 [Chrysophaeum taylorii]
MSEYALVSESPGGYGVLGGAVLLVADCVGTGVLALPGDAWTLGIGGFGALLVTNFVLNLSAGTLVTEAARGGRARDFCELSAGCGATTKAIILAAWYSNLFLVLGQYVLVMSRGLELAVGASCTALSSFAAAASVLALAQATRTMTKLRWPSLASISSVFVVLGLCLAARHRPYDPAWLPPHLGAPRWRAALRASAAVGSCVFAMGTQKLLLNVRREQRDPDAQSNPALALAIALFSAVYLVVVLGAGPRPPAFLLDAISSDEWLRRPAGACLFAHVSVSYAINLQPLAKTLQSHLGLEDSNRRWLALTSAITASAWFVANAVPFFPDLVSLIGAFASAPLNFAIPALLYKHARPKEEHRRREANFHIALTILIVLAGTAGAIVDIVDNWEHHPPPFDC